MGMGGEAVGHGADDRRGRQHADLHRVGAKIREHRIELRSHEGGR